MREEIFTSFQYLYLALKYPPTSPPETEKRRNFLCISVLSRGGGTIPILGDFKLSLGMSTFPFENPKDMEYNTIDKLCQFHDSQGISENQVLVYMGESF